MDQLDEMLFSAWRRISAKLRCDRLAALRRSRRVSGVLAHPQRACCLAIRASDTRFNAAHAHVDPPDAIEQHMPHRLTIDGSLIRRVCAPVHIPPPGVDYAAAAAMLGREYNTIVSWVHSGVLRVKYYNRVRRTGPGSPLVFTDGPIDPNHARGRPPHPAWGTTWQWMHQRIPENFTLTIERAPRLRFDRGSVRFGGWYFRCPGRLIDATIARTHRGDRRDEHEHARHQQHEHDFDDFDDDDGDAARSARFVHQPCGRQTTYLLAPQPLWTLAQALEDSDGVELPALHGRADRWLPGASDSDPIRATGAASFACRQCWNVRHQTWADGTGWNEFVSHISGGLLYGHDVPQPLDLAPVVRRATIQRRWSDGRTGTPRLKPADAFIIAQAQAALRQQREAASKRRRRRPRPRADETSCAPDQSASQRSTSERRPRGREVA